ncbi:DUF3741-associated sequence motif [Arabidopsis thaliana x Arabidopsis arenosa]|uniref:DUF3741-associated sequence motif n=1 Tax=Arabidopsis thaliana x Arabidopsis arenosa TaxID=1240361 RepID=A0A8T2BR35_9BRAS|nr:DUF3741-associated sequence motif [Arabidopsis thaliana x Arabidopsis arenosa]
MTGELQETTAPCAAITEKRPNRLGGCVGVFFQLFDWNRRFAKKKLFSRKSLLPGKQVSKRFGGNEKMLKSKLNLIDDENRGSFPKRGEVGELKKHEMRSPSLVARLMGLESMPSSHRDKGKNKKKKPLFSQIQDTDKCDLFDGEEEEEEDSGFDKLRPQKMQRTTGVCDRRVAVKKFGSDALQIKNVLTRVRKHQQYNSHHQHQKLASPVRSPRLNRRSSRLIDAAARILEPGKRNVKCAIAYPGSSGFRRFENAGKEPVEVVVSPEFQCGYNSSVASCKACGSLVDVNGTSPVVEETGKSVACVSESTPFQRSKRNVFWRNEDSTDQVVRKALHRARYDFNGKHGKDEMSLPGFRNRDYHNKVLHREERFPPEARSFTLPSKRGCSSPANAIKCKEKDFIAMNRGSTSRNHHSKSPVKFENSDLNLQRKSQTRVEESCNRSVLSTPGRKRRLACDSGHGRGSSFTSPGSKRLDGECSCACSNGPSGSNETAFSSLKLGSLHRNYSQCCRETKERKGVQRVPRPSFTKRPPLDVGTLGLIQQKLKELASQEEDEVIGGSALPSKSASLILHELLSSLALEQRYNRDIDMPYAETAHRRKGKTELWSSVGNANSEYTSPGSVLDASFSNESCFSNSFDNVSVPGQMRLPLEPIEPDWNILEDSATSFKNSTSGGNYQAIASLVSHVSNVLRCLSNTGLILTQQRFTISREVIIHTELLVGITKTQENYLIGPELLDELMIYAARSDNLVNLPGLTGGFLVDAMIEHLEERNISCGLLKPFSAKPDELIRGVLEEVPKWTRINMDEVIGIEMEKWLDPETHLFGIGSEIAYEILRCLVSELTTDLGKSLPVKTNLF